jgi:hypothetical protein
LIKAHVPGISLSKKTGNVSGDYFSEEGCLEKNSVETERDCAAKARGGGEKLMHLAGGQHNPGALSAPKLIAALCVPPISLFDYLSRRSGVVAGVPFYVTYECRKVTS